MEVLACRVEEFIWLTHAGCEVARRDGYSYYLVVYLCRKCRFFAAVFEVISRY